MRTLLLEPSYLCVSREKNVCILTHSASRSVSHSQPIDALGRYPGLMFRLKYSRVEFIPLNKWCCGKYEASLFNPQIVVYNLIASNPRILRDSQRSEPASVLLYHRLRLRGLQPKFVEYICQDQNEN